MPIVQAGTINPAAQTVPDLNVVIVPPQIIVFNGVPTNVGAFVGTAVWGPVGTPITVGTMSQYNAAFGTLQARKYDMGTQVQTAILQGANNLKCVRVTDGTDTAASSAGVATCITFTALYSGSLGSTITASLSAGTQRGSFRLVVGIPGYATEVFDNVTGTGNAFWVALAAAINAGSSIYRGPSNIITAAAGAGTTAPAAATFSFTGGTDGVTTITTPVLIGSDSATGGTRTGMYAFRSQGCSVGVLADGDAATSWTTIDAFGKSEGIYFIHTQPAGVSISAAATAVSTAGLDSYASKVMMGDYVWWQDNTNNQLRLVSPQGFIAGILLNLTPNQSTLNKALTGVAGTQKSGTPGSAQVQHYSTADLQLLFQGGMDVIANPGAGGVAIWCARGGYNSSSLAAIRDDSYPRMRNFLATSFGVGLAPYEGLPITPALFRQIRASAMTFLSTCLRTGLLSYNADGSLPYTVQCDANNNPQSRTGLGYVQCDINVTYQGINKFFTVNLQGGATVVTQPSSGTPAS